MQHCAFWGSVSSAPTANLTPPASGGWYFWLMFPAFPFLSSSFSSSLASGGVVIRRLLYKARGKTLQRGCVVCVLGRCLSAMEKIISHTREGASKGSVVVVARANSYLSCRERIAISRHALAPYQTPSRLCVRGGVRCVVRREVKQTGNRTHTRTGVPAIAESFGDAYKRAASASFRTF